MSELPLEAIGVERQPAAWVVVELSDKGSDFAAPHKAEIFATFSVSSIY